jgi:hypothetical protein
MSDPKRPVVPAEEKVIQDKARKVRDEALALQD